MRSWHDSGAAPTFSKTYHWDARYLTKHRCACCHFDRTPNHRPRGRTPSPRRRSNPRRQKQNPRRRNGDNGLGSRPNGNNGLRYTIPRRGWSGTTRRPRRPRLKGPIASRNIGDGQVIQVRCWNDAQCASASLPSVAEITTSKWTQGVRPCFVFIRVMAEGDAHECSVGDGTMSRLVAP